MSVARPSVFSIDKTVRRRVQVVDPHERVRARHLVRERVQRFVAAGVDGLVDRVRRRADPVAVGVLHLGEIDLL